MIHQSQVFVCPGQDHGIAWNICQGRQDACWELCASCPYAGWRSQGLPGFNPYAGAFTPSEDPRRRLSSAPRRPVRGPIYDAPVRSFTPADIGLEEPTRKRGMIRWLRAVYDAI